MSRTKSSKLIFSVFSLEHFPQCEKLILGIIRISGALIRQFVNDSEWRHQWALIPCADWSNYFILITSFLNTKSLENIAFVRIKKWATQSQMTGTTALLKMKRKNLKKRRKIKKSKRKLRKIQACRANNRTLRPPFWWALKAGLKNFCWFIWPIFISSHTTQRLLSVTDRTSFTKLNDLKYIWYILIYKFSRTVNIHFAG